MKSLRHSWVSVSAAALVVLAVGWGVQASQGAQATKAKAVSIAFFGYNSTPYSLAALNAAQKAAKKYGATVHFFDPNSDPTVQATQMRDAITSGNYQGWWVWANNGLALQPIVVQAQHSGIKVATADATLGSTNDQATLKSEPGVTVAIGTGLKEEAQIAVSEIKRACTAQVGAGKSCNVALMPGMDNFPSDVYRLGIIQPALKAAGDIKATLMPQGMYTTPGAQKSTLDFYQTKPKVDVIYTFADQMIAGVLVALKQVGVTPGKNVQLIGFGATTEAVAGIHAGTWFASQALYPSTESTLAVKDIVAAVQGKSVPKVIDVYKLPGALPVIDKTALKQHPSFKADWSYAG